MSLDSLLAGLRVPADFNRYNDIPERDVIARLDRWKEDALRTLQELQTRVVQERGELSLKQQADIISTASVFDCDAAWVTPASEAVALDILQSFSEPPLPLLVQILQYNLKPLFRSNPHPSINLETGRKLTRPAGGPMASQDFYDSQTLEGVARRVKRSAVSTAYQDLWHLVIPPLMALLDDYEARYKLIGVRITSAMLERVPSTVLKRTGVDSLLIDSLSRSLTQLQSPETPRLLPAAISTSLTLIQLMTSTGSVERFDQLCALLGDGIIGSIWPYASDRLPALLAVVIAQLVHPLAPLEYEKTSVELQLSSLRALSAVINACPERIPYWKGTVLNGVARCWLSIVAPVKTPDTLKQELRNVCSVLAVVCPSVLQEEYPRFIAADATIFRDLLGTTT
ncbi:hypothetical protein C8R46DRAFT_1160062 [Mycena filopes]|nr:hypothetical protein C8R46DRAFT_1160062 [Mycena filopes]